MADIILGVLAIVAGGAMLVAGQFVLRIMIPIWGFFAGFAVGRGVLFAFTAGFAFAFAFAFGAGFAVPFALAAVFAFAFAFGAAFALPFAFWFKPVCVFLALFWLTYRAYQVLT